jgi:hypothetical protein
MERIRRFMLDERASAEATSSVVMIAAVGILLGLGVAAYYGALNGFFQDSQAAVNSYGGRMTNKF